MRVEKEVDKADVANAIIVAIGGRELSVNYDFFETVADMFERECLLRHLFFIGNHPCRLDINTLVASIDNKINFMGVADCRAVRPGETFKMSDIYIVTTPFQFAVNDIFHQMGAFTLPLSDVDVSDSCICGVIFGR